MSKPAKIDSFTLKRLGKLLRDLRTKTGQYATLADVERAGFSKEVLEAAVKAKVVEEGYVTLTTGAVVKIYVWRGLT